MAKRNSNIEVQNFKIANPVSSNASSPSMEQQIRDMSNEVTARTFDFNSSEAQKARDFQEYMSNTSHQREVDDLKRAGLNPVLSANGGASAYSAASASGSADNSAIGMLGSIYMNKMNNDNALKIAKMQNDNNKEIAKINASASKYASDNSFSASRYATDRSKYGLIDNFVNGILGQNNSSSNSGSKLGNLTKKFFSWSWDQYNKKR